MCVIGVLWCMGPLHVRSCAMLLVVGILGDSVLHSMCLWAPLCPDVCGCALWCLIMLVGVWQSSLSSFWVEMVWGGGVCLLLWLKVSMCGSLVLVALVRGLLLACDRLCVGLVAKVSMCM